MKKLTLFSASMLVAMLAGMAPRAFAQTYIPEHARAITLAGNGTDVTNTLTIQAAALSGSSTLTLPGGNTAGVLLNDGAGNLTWVPVSTIVTGLYLPTAGGTMTGNINMGGKDITNAGSITATTFNGALNGNANTATTATNFSGSLAGDVIGTQGATAIDGTSSTAGGHIIAALTTNAGTLTNNTSGNAATATNATNAANLSGSNLSGDVSNIGNNITVTTVPAGALPATVTTQGNTFNGNSQLVQTTAGGLLPVLDGSNLTNITGANVTGTVANATNAATATNFSGSLAGDVIGTQGATAIDGTSSTAGGHIIAALTTNAGTLTNNTSGNAATATNATNAANLSGSNLSGDVSNIGNNITVTTVPAGALPATVTTQGNTFNGNSQLVQTTAGGLLPVLDGSNLTNITGANVTGTVANATNAATATNFSGSLAGDVIGTQGATAIDGSSSAAGGHIISALTANAGTLTNNTSGNAGSATTIATTAASSNISYYPLFVSSSTNGNQAANFGTGLTFNPSTNALTTTSENLGVAGSSTGSLNLANISGANVTTIQAGASAPAMTYVLPTSGPSSSGQVLSANGTTSPIQLSWTTASGGGSGSGGQITGANGDATLPNHGQSFYYTPAAQPPGGNGAQTTVSLTKKDVMTVNGACTLSNLQVVLDAAPGTNAPITFTLYSNHTGTWASTGITTTITGTATSGADNTHTYTLSAGDQLSMQISGTGTVDPASKQAAWAFGGAGSSATGLTNPMTTTGDMIYASDNTGTASRLAGNSTTTKQFLTSTGSGSAATAPVWSALSASDIPSGSGNYIQNSTSHQTSPSNFSIDTGTALTFAGQDGTAGTALTVRGGNGSSTTGGALTIEAGRSASGSGPGVSILGRNANTSGTGGNVTVTAGNAAGTNQAGGNIALMPGTRTGTGTPGGVGINTSAPNTDLDINGDWAVRNSNNTSTASTLNDVSTASASNITFTSETADFTVTGFANGSDGKMLRVYNHTGHNLTFAHMSSSSLSSDQISTLSAGDLTLPTNGVAKFVYDAASGNWVMEEANARASTVTGLNAVGITYTIEGSDQTSTSDVTDATLRTPILANATYEVRGVLVINSSGTSQSFNLGFSVPGTSTVSVSSFCAANLTGSNNFQAALLVTGSGSGNEQQLGIGNNVVNFITISGIIKSNTAGTAALLWHGTSGATLKTSSYLCWTRVQ